ncbi:hypothetical protein, partial [Rhodobacter capsulatus]
MAITTRDGSVKGTLYLYRRVPKRYASGALDRLRRVMGVIKCHPTKTPGTSDKNREQLGIAGNRRFVSIDHSVMIAM